MANFERRTLEWLQDFVIVDNLDTRVRQGTQNTQIQPEVSVEKEEEGEKNFEWESSPVDDDDEDDLPELPVERYGSVWEAMIFQL